MIHTENILTQDQMLKYVIDNGIIDVATIQNQIEMNERKKYLNQHDRTVYQDKNGDWNTYLYDERFKTGRKLIRKHTKTELEDVIVSFYKDKEQKPTIKSVFEEWINERIEFGEITKQTYDRYKSDFNRFFVQNDTQNLKIEYITENDLERFIKLSIKNNNLSAKAWGGLRILINGMFKYAKKHGYTTLSVSTFLGDLVIPKNMFKRVKFEDEDSVFTAEEKRLMKEYVLEYLNNDIIALGVLLAFESGVRVGELCALKHSDFENNLIKVRRTEVHYKKDGQRGYEYEVRDFTKGAIGYREVIITDEAVKLYNRIKRINPFGEYIFMADGERIKEHSFSYKIRFLCKKLDIKVRSMHKVRKTYATELFNAGVDEKLIIDQMGHTDINTTKNHYRFNNRKLEERAEIINRAIS